MNTKVKTRTWIALLNLLFLFTAINAQPVRQHLHEGWNFRQARGTNWYEATVPGTVHTDLMDNKLIDDPFYRLNERGVQWVDKEDWIYRTTFDVTPELLAKKNIVLHFEGLDTYADVTLNGKKILSADNMFCEWQVDVRSLLKEHGNELQVYLHSPIKIAMPKWEAVPFQYRSSNDQSENGGLLNRKIGVFVRKAGYHFGWDWGPRLVTSGIWRTVSLEAWDEARINDVFYNQQSVTAQRAIVNVTVEVLADKETEAKVAVINRTDKRTECRKLIRLNKGLNKIPVSFTMKKPRLWWTNGLGEPFLYDFAATLELNGKHTNPDKEIGFQKGNVLLAQRLKEVLTSHEEGHLVCISDTFENIYRYNRKARRFWRTHFFLYGSWWDRLLLPDRLYYNTFITRPYMDFASKEDCPRWFHQMKAIWKDRDVVFIEGEKSRLGVGNDLFDNVKSIRRILCPPRDAFDRYEEILNEAQKLEKTALFLIALGPTARRILQKHR